MSTLNLPAVIARLHGTEQYRRGEIQAPRKSLVKLPDVKHTAGVGVGNHHWVSIQSKDSFWKQPLYLRQVLRQHGNAGSLQDGTAYNNSRRLRQGHPSALPKLNDKPIKNTNSAVPVVKGKNLESLDSEITKTTTTLSSREDGDEDSTWARNAFSKKTSKDIVRSYDEVPFGHITNINDRKSCVPDKVKNDLSSRTKLVKFSKLDILPPLGRKPVGDFDMPQPDQQNDPDLIYLDYKVDECYLQKDLVKPNTRFSTKDNNEHEIKAALVTSFNSGKPKFDFDRSMGSGRKSYLPRQTKAAVRQEASAASKSTFSRTLPTVSPTTHAGKKLLSSLLARTNKENKKPRLQTEVRFAPPGSVLYAEQYLHATNILEQRRALKGEKTSQVYKNATSFGKLPAVMVGQHFQHTYRNLWKYVFAKEHGQKMKSHYWPRNESRKSNADVIYIPTGRPEDALSVGKADISRMEEKDLASKPIKLKYIHRDSDENQDRVRSKDTSPWNIDEQLQTPKEAQNHPIQNTDVLVSYSPCMSKVNDNITHDEGIRKLRITMPKPDVLAPPSSPVFSVEEKNTSSDAKTFHSNNSFGELYPTASNNGTYGVKRDVSQVPTLYYSTPVKIIDYKSKQTKSEKEKVKEGKRKSTKPTGPVPITKSNVTSKAASQSKLSASKKTRLYTHGQYLVKVEGGIVKTGKIKMPKDFNNMFTKPYTFSYLTGVQAPCHLSSQISKHSRNVANISSTRHPNGDNQTQTTLVSEIRKVDNPSTVQEYPKTQDACTQFDYEYVADIQDGDDVENGSFRSICHGESEADALKSLFPLSADDSSALVDEASEAIEDGQTPRKSRMRALSEGAQEDDIRMYHDEVAAFNTTD